MVEITKRPKIGDCVEILMPKMTHGQRYGILESINGWEVTVRYIHPKEKVAITIQLYESEIKLP